MPAQDGTGPLGQGAGTGRGLGPCGAGAKRGTGRGMGRGFGFRQNVSTQNIPQDTETEKSKKTNK